MVVIWNTITSQFIAPESQHRSRITDARFVPYTSYVAASSLDKIVQIWDANKSLEVWITCFKNNTEAINAHSGNVSAMCTSSKAEPIASTSNDNCFKIVENNMS